MHHSTLRSRSLRRRAASLLALVSMLSSGCVLGEDGNGERVDDVRALEGFHAIVADDSLDVLVERGDTFAVTVSIDSNLVELVRTRVENGTLRIDTRERIDEVVPGPHVRVTMPHLDAAKLAGSGRLDALSFAESEPVRLTLSGSGDLAFEGTAPLVTADLSGSGYLSLTGTAGRVELDLDGSGDLDARRCTASSAKLRVDGSGDITATVNGAVDAAIHGSGDIALYGAPVLEHADERGSGDIRVHP